MDEATNVIVPENKPLSLRIADFLQSQIILRKLKQGEQLVESELAEMFKTSRGPIREALRMLERDGFVEMIPRRGAFVRRFSAKEIEDVYMVRSALEKLALELAVPKLTDEDVKRMEFLLQEMKAAVEKGDVKDYYQFNVLFHQVVLDVANNTFLRETFGRLNKPLVEFRITSLSLPNSLAESFHEHAIILDAIKEKNLELAKTHLESHLYRAMEKLKICAGEHKPS